MRGQIHALKLTRMTPSTIASVVLYRAGEITRDATRRLEGRALLAPTAGSVQVARTFAGEGPTHLRMAHNLLRTA